MTKELKLPQLNYLLEEYPWQHDFISRLDTFIYGRKSSLELDTKEAFDILQPTDMRTFVQILKSLKETKLVEYCIQVNNSDGEKLQQFSSILDIPETMVDFRTGKEFTVLLTDVVAKYIFHSPHNITNRLKIK